MRKKNIVLDTVKHHEMYCEHDNFEKCAIKKLFETKICGNNVYLELKLGNSIKSWQKTQNIAN